MLKSNIGLSKIYHLKIGEKQQSSSMITKLTCLSRLTDVRFSPSSAQNGTQNFKNNPHHSKEKAR